MAKLQQKTRPKSSMSSLLNNPAFAAALGDAEEEESEEVELPRLLETPPPAAVPNLRIVEATPPIESIPTPLPEAVLEKIVAKAVTRLSVSQVIPSRPAAGTSLIRGGELYLTERTDKILQELVFAFKRNTNKAVASTHVLRGILLALEPHLAEIQREAEALGPLKRPGNETQYAAEREAFERTIGQAVVRAVK